MQKFIPSNLCWQDNLLEFCYHFIYNKICQFRQFNQLHGKIDVNLIEITKSANLLKLIIVNWQLISLHRSEIHFW